MMRRRRRRRNMMMRRRNGRRRRRSLIKVWSVRGFRQRKIWLSGDGAMGHPNTRDMMPACFAMPYYCAGSRYDADMA